MVTWRLSNNRMTIRIKTDEDRIIVDAAPIARKFLGQHLERLVRWMQKQGTTEIQRLSEE